jgi:SAM-dependent methyltransferase
MQSAGQRGFAPAADRNVGPIVATLRRMLPPHGRALEVASGTGQHVVAFAAAFPQIEWLPSDPDPAARASIAAWSAHAGAANVRAPLALDVAAADWEAAADGPFDAVLAINLIHIAPWEAALGLFRGAARLLAPGGVMYLYGPYLRAEGSNAPSNLAFDRALRAQNEGWGVRELGAVIGAADAAGLALERAIEMPANNLSLALRRR